MTPLQAVVLAVVQGVTEFLPISSSGHLILVPRLFGWPDQGLDFDVAIHAGTLLAVLVTFRRDLRDLAVGFLRGPEAAPGADYDPRRLGWALILGTVPAVACGLALQEVIATQARNPQLIAGTLIGYGLLLGVADRVGPQRRELTEVGLGAALLIGCAQALALVPGTSRSGATITAALLLGFTRPAAARFSFLLSVPVMLAAAALDAVDLATGEVPAGRLGLMALGVAVSAVTGYLVIAGLLAWLRRRSLLPFVAYRLLLGTAILALWAY
ncbi:MAG TPA: undecaprenyl-diphosphate phosphatase [Thermoanaerobaculia bacterium]|nr:undecaprenyl-diphosphate phosphatase [Thermoanaerobaculia bacterium]